MPEFLASNPILVIVGVVVVFFILMLIIASRYVKVGPNKALIISGGRRGIRLLKGGGTFVWPVIEQVQELSLEVFTLNIKMSEVYTITGVPIIVEAVSQVKVGGDENSIRTSSEQFLNKNINDVIRIMLLTMEGHLRAIVGTMTVEDIYKNREQFAQKVQEVAATDLSNMGLKIISFTLQHITDDHGYLDALGKPRTAQVLRDATIGKAIAESEASQKSAIAQQAAKEVEYAAQAKIAEAQRSYQLKQAEYEADVNRKKAEFQITVNERKAEADLAYNIQTAKTAQVLKEQETRTAELEAKRKEQELLATTIKPAEAERRKIETVADANRYRFEIESKGQAEATRNINFAEADAQKAKGFASAEVIQAQGQAEATSQKAQGLAKADVILAQGQAEAQAMQKKAEAWKSYNEAAIIETLIAKLPEIAKAVSEPLSKTEKIVVVSMDGSAGTGVSKITRDVTQVIAQVPPLLEALSGVDLTKLIKNLPKMGDNPSDGKKKE